MRLRLGEVYFSLEYSHLVNAVFAILHTSLPLLFVSHKFKIFVSKLIT